jgi:hypothetical protein
MRHSFTAVLSKNERLTSDFETEPFETCWATEARVFINVLELSGENPRWDLQVQISPDGLCWCDHESAPLTIVSQQLYSIGLHDMGHWVRIKGTAASGESMLRSIIYLALKE